MLSLNGFIFRNINCTRCHGLSNITEYLELSVKCSDEIGSEAEKAAGLGDEEKVLHMIEKAMKDNLCQLSYTPASIALSARRFLQYRFKTIDSCPSNRTTLTYINDQVENECKRYQSLVRSDGTSNILLFKNPHCAFCNGYRLDNFRDHMFCGSLACKYKTDVYGVGGVGSFTLLVDVNPRGEVNSLRHGLSGNQCPLGYMHDDISKQCQRVQCPLGSVTNGTSCIQYYKNVPQVFQDGGQTIVSIIYKYTKEDVLYTIIPAFIQLIYTLPHVSLIDNNLDCSNLPMNGTDKIFQNNIKDGQTKFDTCIAFKVIPSQNTRIHDAFRNIIHITKAYDLNKESASMLFYNFDITHEINCKSGKGLHTESVVLHTTSANIQNVYIRNTGFYEPVENVPLMFFLPHFQGSLLSMIDMRDMSTSVMVCVEDVEPLQFAENQWLGGLTTKGIVTSLGISLSIVALFLTFINLCFKICDLKGIFRILLINLTVALFIAQTTFLLQELFLYNEQVCQAIAIFQHYSWLSYFFSMNSVAIEVAIRFRSLASMTKARNELARWNFPKRKWLVLLLHGWVSPLFLVIAGVVLDFGFSSRFSPLYGKGTACWLNNPSALLVLFVIPFCSIVGLNCCLVLFAIIRLRQISNIGGVLSQERSHFNINLKLSALMGVSWIVGLVGSYTNLEPFWYIFIILNSLQGVVIFFTFALPKRT